MKSLRVSNEPKNGGLKHLANTEERAFCLLILSVVLHHL